MKRFELTRGGDLPQLGVAAFTAGGWPPSPRGPMTAGLVILAGTGPPMAYVTGGPNTPVVGEGKSVLDDWHPVSGIDQSRAVGSRS